MYLYRKNKTLYIEGKSVYNKKYTSEDKYNWNNKIHIA